MNPIWLVLVAGVLSLVYGVVTTAQLMAADAGSPRMQEIAAAIAEGAQAYLRRQYLTIAAVGIVIFVVLGFLLSWPVAIGFAHRRDPLRRGRVHRHERLGARQRAHRAGGVALARRGLDISFKAGAITGMLVAGLALLGVAGTTTS